MSVITKQIKIGGNPLNDQDGTAVFTTDWFKVDQPYGLGKMLIITAHFPNTLTGGATQQMALEVSNDGVNAIELLEVDIDDAIEEEMNWAYFRFDYRITGAPPTGGVISKIQTGLV